jgi:predicted enzyme related to lactoylglutathione lyase
MLMSRPVHFDLSADNPLRAADFYRNVFGWKVEKWEGPEDYWMMKTGDETNPGVTGGIAGRISPNDTTAVVFDVTSVDEVAKVVQASGGEIREPKKAIPGVGYLVMCKDTEGNTFGIMQIDQSVK